MFSEIPVLPAANFSTNVTIGTVPLSVQFNDLSKNATGWDWNFGDGINSTQQNPMHTYLASRKLYRNTYSRQFEWYQFNDKKHKCSQKRNNLEPFGYIQ